jgi:Amt family ammonium transporter
MLFNGITIDSMSGDIPETVFASFQMTFAIITPALVVGAFVERIKFSSMLIFSVLWTLVVYFPVANWVWGGGWLGQMGLIDFAGGTVVHITAGVAALVTALVIGKRKDFLSAATLPHNLTMSFTGAAMLWVGWFGFNAGSALAADGAAGMALFVTHISAATGALTWIIIEWIKFGKPSGLGAITGMVAGLATITPASGSVGPAGALLVGLSGGVICYFATTYLKQTVKIDDSLDVFPVHGVGGMVGTFLAGILVSANLGVFSGNGLAEGMTVGSQVGVQVIGILATAIYTAIMTFILLKLVGVLTSGIRVSEEQEQQGLDITDHDEKGYSM